jgi:hypothetical protein
MQVVLALAHDVVVGMQVLVLAHDVVVVQDTT